MDLYGLSWNNYRESITGSLRNLIRDEDFVDVSLHCEGRVLKAHKVYLSAASDYFKSVLKGTNLWQHPILFLSEIPFVDLQKILEFIYCGEIQIPKKKLTSFLKSAESLKINGLIENISNINIREQHLSIPNTKKKKRRKGSEDPDLSINLEQAALINSEVDALKTELVMEEPLEDLEQVIVKADPEDFQVVAEDEQNFANSITSNINEEESSVNRGIVIRNDLMNPESPVVSTPLYGERGRCHFCQLLCPDRKSLTDHLKSSHQPPKHSLCENCENFFHICAITRHREKCKARYQTDR